MTRQERVNAQKKQYRINSVKQAFKGGGRAYGKNS